MSPIEQITVADGKYTVINDCGKLTALRHGEPWNRDLVGDNLVYWMMVRIQELEAKVAQFEKVAHITPQELTYLESGCLAMIGKLTADSDKPLFMLKDAP